CASPIYYEGFDFW
nr:immunoglobulin heavy chain junction region [Mus musculus]NSM06718.1 immunoglobulin heavy chain junction region [Mus musculus]NSM07053.1 immunoglobulin heavy chain junction region [Mus musculus]NSM09291.1 immunoglobulin heavy chain junction region [Mus musculus]